MTSTERLTRLFDRRPLDRIPVWLLFPLSPTTVALPVQDLPSYRPLMGPVYCGSDFIERRFYAHGPCLSARIPPTEPAQSPLVASAADLHRLLEEPWNPATPDLASYEKEKALLGDRGIMAAAVPDPLELLHSLCDETEFTVLCWTETKTVTVFLDEMLRRCLAWCDHFLHAGVPDLFWISGAEYATPPMLSLELFRRLVVPYNRAIVEHLRRKGKKTMLHCHGRIGSVLREIAAIGPDALHPLEPVPLGDCSLRAARVTLGPDMIFTGNLQYGDLFTLAPRETAHRVEAVLEQAGGPLILSLSASPTAAVIDDRVVANYMAILETAEKYGRFG